VLVYAFRSDLPHHGLCRSWLSAIINGDGPFGLSPLVLSAVVRITTNHRAFAIPSLVDEAFGFCDDLLVQPHARIVEPGERHWEIFERLCITTNTAGLRVSDAWLAALAIEWGCELITLDRDFARFPGLKWRTPATA